MAFSSGKSAVVKFGTAASETDISAYCDSADFSRAFAKLDTTTFGQSDHTYIPGLGDVSFKFGGNYDPTVHGVLYPLLGVAAQSLIYGPVGSAGGALKLTCTAFLSKYDLKSPVAGKVTFDAEITISGAPTPGTF